MRFLLLSLLFCCVACTEGIPRSATPVGAKPTLYPDYTDLVLPPNIAPLCFAVRNAPEGVVATFWAGDELLFTVASSDSVLSIPRKRWAELAARGGTFRTVVYAKNNGAWQQYEPFDNRFSADSIDRYLTYRLIAPGYELWRDMGIYQRDLSSFDQQALLANTATGTGCMNCHAFADYSAQTAMLHLRGTIGGTLIKRNGAVSKHGFKTPEMIGEGTYSSWHPSGRYIAFSTNRINQYFHLSGHKPIEVSDEASDLVLYDVERNEVLADSLVFGAAYMETFPEWSPDGRTLYFTRARALEPTTKIDSIHYDLCALDFDPSTGRLSNLRTLVAASAERRSVAFPRVVAGGRYVVYTAIDYGNFSIWHPESDLWLLDLTTLATRPLDELNSPLAESYHSQSSNGRWIVVSSRRQDGLYTRPYLAHFDSQSGVFSKPFVVPQSSPDFYDNLFYSYNLPQFTRDRFEGRDDLLRTALSTDKIQAQFVL